MCEHILDKYINIHQDVLSVEKAGPVKSVIKVFQRVEPERIGPALRIYQYMRILDNAVENESPTQPVQELLKNELRGVVTGEAASKFQDYWLFEPLNQLFPQNSQIIRDRLIEIIQGISMDLDIRKTQLPLNNEQMRKRNYLVTYPPLAIFSMGKYGLNPLASNDMVDAINDLASYDNVSDFFEDLPTGLNLITKEDMTRFNLSFTDGKPLPVDLLMQYNRTKRAEIRRRLRGSSKAIFSLGLPPIFSTLLYLYFYTRSLKLFIPLPEQQGLVYRTPEDADRNFCSV